MSSPSRPARKRTDRRGLVYRLTYSNCHSEDNTELFRCRDAIALLELTAPLMDAGYQYATTIHLYPYDERDLSQFPVFQPEDILALTTRPPLREDDEEAVVHPVREKARTSERTRKRIHKTETQLEDLLSGRFRDYVEYCSRKQVVLTERGVRCLRPENRARWRHLEFYEYRGLGRNAASEIKYHIVRHEQQQCDPDRHSTVAFLMRFDRIPGIQCSCIASFGIDGYSTLIWNRIVRRQFANLLLAPCFVMAELIFKSPIPPRPLTPEFVDNGQVVEVRLLTAPR